MGLVLIKDLWLITCGWRELALKRSLVDFCHPCMDFINEESYYLLLGNRSGEANSLSTCNSSHTLHVHFSESSYMMVLLICDGLPQMEGGRLLFMESCERNLHTQRSIHVVILFLNLWNCFILFLDGKIGGLYKPPLHA